MSYVYFAECSKRIKIGFSKEPEERVRQLQTGSAHHIELLGFVEGTMRQERHAHELLARHRIQGEWFSSSGEVRGFVALAIAFGLSAALVRQRNGVVVSRGSTDDKVVPLHILRDLTWAETMFGRGEDPRTVERGLRKRGLSRAQAKRTVREAKRL